MTHKMTPKLLVSIAAMFLATQAWADPETVLWNFNLANGNAGNPFANNLISNGLNFYGVTWEGGNYPGCLNGCGTVFELSPNSDGGWNETLLYSFDPVNGSDGSNPVGGLVRDRQGNLYGATYFGGSSTNCNNGCGTIFELTPSSSGWTETVLYSFTGNADGNYPYSTLAMDGEGNLYGTAYGGGSDALGTVYELSASSTGMWVLTTLHSFTGGPDGSYPEGAVVFDMMGNLCGTTSGGGPYGYGSVYQLSRGLNGWTEKILHGFDVTDGASPAWVSVTMDKAGNLYGTTQDGGANNTGTVWELVYSANYAEIVLHSFGPKGGKDGNYPWAGVMISRDGTLYGTTVQGGTDDWGIIFALTKSSSRNWTERILHSFTGGDDGGQPSGGLLYGDNDRQYGIAGAGGSDGVGVVFEMAP